MNIQLYNTLVRLYTTVLLVVRQQDDSSATKSNSDDISRPPQSLWRGRKQNKEVRICCTLSQLVCFVHGISYNRLCVWVCLWGSRRGQTRRNFGRHFVLFVKLISFFLPFFGQHLNFIYITLYLFHSLNNLILKIYYYGFIISTVTLSSSTHTTIPLCFMYILACHFSVYNFSHLAYCFQLPFFSLVFLAPGFYCYTSEVCFRPLSGCLIRRTPVRACCRHYCCCCYCLLIQLTLLLLLSFSLSILLSFSICCFLFTLPISLL